jgi:hypothetical protein
MQDYNLTTPQAAPSTLTPLLAAVATAFARRRPVPARPAAAPEGVKGDAILQRWIDLSA